MLHGVWFVQRQEPRPFDVGQITGDSAITLNFRTRLERAKGTQFWYKDDFNLKLLHIDPGTGTATTLFDLGAAHPNVLDDRPNRVFTDNQGNSWINCSNGVYKVRVAEGPFTNYVSLPQQEYTAASGSSCRGLLVHEQKLLVTTNWRSCYEINL